MTCIFTFGLGALCESFTLFLFIVSIYLIQGQIFKVPLIENYLSDLYEIYRVDLADYKEYLYQLSRQSKIFLNFMILDFNWYSGFL